MSAPRLDHLSAALPPFGPEATVCRQTAIYATGVGLGASKGKEVGKYQEGYAGYVNMAKDSVSYIWVSPPGKLDRPLNVCTDRHESDTRVERYHVVERGRRCCFVIGDLHTVNIAH